MERINSMFFYDLGARITPLCEMKVGRTARIDIWIIARQVDAIIRSLFDYYSALTVCRRTGIELLKAIGEVANWVHNTTPPDLEKKDYSIDNKFRLVIDKAKEFQTVLCEELQTLATYHVSQKGIYSTIDLIDKAEQIFPKPVLEKLSTDIVEEIRQSGKCLAFDVATASAFHIMRVVEIVMHKYYLNVCKPKTEGRLDSWGAYITALNQAQAPEIKEVVAMLQQLKDRHRNLIMHPEIVLSPDEAFTLFEIAQGAIIAMAERLPALKGK